MAMGRCVKMGLNKGRNKERISSRGVLEPAGEIRDPSFENQRYCANGLNLVVTAIILWKQLIKNE